MVQVLGALDLLDATLFVVKVFLYDTSQYIQWYDPHIHTMVLTYITGGHHKPSNNAPH